MPCEHCNCHATAEPVQAESAAGPALSRRAALLSGASAVAALLSGFGSSALARTLRKAFHPPVGSRRIGNLKHLRPNSALSVTDPHSGQAAVVVRLSSKKQVVAYSAICTHAGCTVGYDAVQKLLVCPCHGSVYNPARGAAVVRGPAPTSLPRLKVAVDPKGNLWLA